MVITNCSNCSLSTKCPIIKKDIDVITKKLDKYLKTEKKKIYDKPINEIDKFNHLEDLNHKIRSIRIDMISKIDKLCKYEQDIYDDTFNQIDSEYKLSDNLFLLNLVEQLIKLKIYDFRLMKEHNVMGLFITVGDKVKIVPGLHYSMEISNRITDIMEKIEKIVNGEKVNIDGEVVYIDASEIFGDIKEIKGKFKEIE